MREYVLADATRYSIPDGQEPDIIVSETMAVCLHNEPQITIARHLLGQAPQAKLVPSSVSIEAWLIDLAKEHVFVPAEHTGPIPSPQRDRVYLGKVFELDAENIKRWKGLSGDRLPAGEIAMPETVEPRYLVHLLTKIVVHGEHRLQDYDSSLTMPRPVRHKVEAGTTLRFHYQLGRHPKLVIAPFDDVLKFDFQPPAAYMK